jgi:hypothetical protein
VLEVDNIIYCTNFKFQKYMRSRNVLIKRHVTRHIGYNQMIPLLLCGRSLSSCTWCVHSDFNSTFVVKMLYWSMTEDITYST